MSQILEGMLETLKTEKKCLQCHKPMPKKKDLPMFLKGGVYCSGICEKKAKGL